MNPADIFLPAMALVGWTLCVLLAVPYRRLKAVVADQVTIQDFKLGESARVPPTVSIPNRTFMNLLEAPLLFYFVTVVSFVTQSSSAFLVSLAWLYFFFRVVQSLVHLTYNNVVHRGLAFAASNGVLVVMWASLFVALVGKNG